jgi:hypothetical protein
MSDTFPHYNETDLDKNQDELENRLLKASLAGMRAGDGALLVIDFVIMGATQRTLTNLAAFIHLVKQKYYSPASALCRLQLDTLMRLHAFSLVKDPHKLAQWIFDGKHLKHYQLDGKQKLYDAYLVKSLESELPSISKVYESLSSFIHFSDRHFFTAARSTDPETRQVNFKISRVEEADPAKIDELCYAFFDITARIHGRISGYPKFKEHAVQGIKH